MRGNSHARFGGAGRGNSRLKGRRRAPARLSRVALTKTDRTATCRLTRIDWETAGRIIDRVGAELLPADRLNDLFEISIDEVAWRKGHHYLTLVGDHRTGRVAWGADGKGQAAADTFFAEPDPDPEPAACSSPPPQLDFDSC